jgi:hypothetical protein
MIRFQNSILLGAAGAVILTGCEGKFPGASPPERDLSTAINSIVAVQKCAALAAGAGGERGYPASLAALARGARPCMNESIVSRDSAGSKMLYFPVRDSTGIVRRFWVMSRDVSGLPGTPAYIGDQNGQVFEANYDPRWDTTGPADTAKLLMRRSPITQLRRVWTCIHSNYLDYGHLYPVDLSRAGNRQPAPQCVSSPDQNNGSIDVDLGDRAGSGRFTLKYQVGDRNYGDEWGPGFFLTVRPVAYGDPSIRSFVTDPKGGIHFTTQKREATVDDPLVFGCEGQDFGECSLALSAKQGARSADQSIADKQ